MRGGGGFIQKVIVLVWETASKSSIVGWILLIMNLKESIVVIAL